jgi:hypothetical protein
LFAGAGNNYSVTYDKGLLESKQTKIPGGCKALFSTKNEVLSKRKKDQKVCISYKIARE